MKKYIADIRIAAIVLAASAAAFAACTSEEYIVEEQPAEPQRYTLTVAASKGEDAATRALSLDDKTLNAAWATSEHVYVQKGGTWASGSLQPQAGGATATLSGTLSDIEINADDNLTLQFPKSGEVSYDGQSGTLADIAANFDYATATVEVESVSASGSINPKAATTTFANQQAIIKFTLKKSDGSPLPGNPTAFTVSDGTSTVSLTDIPAATYTTNGDGVLFVAFPATGSAATITLTATVGSATYTYEKSGVTFTNGTYRTITVKMALPTDGDGYYLLGSVQDWKDFAEIVNSGTNASANARMTADIDLGDDQTHIGTIGDSSVGRVCYSGIFDGQGHTLTVAYVGTTNYSAPFTQTKNATIKNIHVTGTIQSAYGQANGILSVARGDDYISNAWVSVNITSTGSGWQECASICGVTDYVAHVYITDCLFTGEINFNGSYNGCFLGYNSGSATITNCLSTGTFKNGSSNDFRGTHTNCYVKQFPSTIPTAMQLTDEQLTDGTITANLNNGRTGADAPWVQDAGADEPRLALFVNP